MSLFTLRASALAGSIVAGLVGAWAVPSVAQERTTPPVFSPNPILGWIGAGDIRPVPGVTGGVNPRIDGAACAREDKGAVEAPGFFNGMAIQSDGLSVILSVRSLSPYWSSNWTP